jgi:hypothetical protein
MASEDHQRSQSFSGEDASHAHKTERLTPTSGKTQKRKGIQRTPG